jgi:hypothetical protein
MCGSCDNDEMCKVNELFGELYSMGYTVSYTKTFNDILKQLRHDACFKPELRKYSVKLDEFTAEWMEHMTASDIECYRRPPDGCLPYRYVESNITEEQAKAMTLEELEKAVKDSYYAPEMDVGEQDIRLPLFRSAPFRSVPSSRLGRTSYNTHKHKLPRFQL